MTRRLGILTGGGDCPGLNAALRSVVKHATCTYDFEVVGICDAFKGLYEGQTMALPVDRVRGVLDRGGTILGSSNRANPFAYPVGTKGHETIEDVSDVCVANYHKLGLEGLIVVGRGRLLAEGAVEDVRLAALTAAGTVRVEDASYVPLL